jgi:DNA-binding response OmpR family regulator
MTVPLVLLVEDDTVLQEVLDTALVEAGFSIILASSGSQAMTELESDVARFQAVITDIKLGKGPDGWEVGRRARELAGDIPVVYMSGNSEQEWSSKGVPNSVMITKPFAAAQLVTAVATLINDVNTHRASQP